MVSHGTISDTSHEALVSELGEARRAMRGDILRGRARLACESQACPVRAVRVDFVEELGATRPMQHCRSSCVYEDLKWGYVPLMGGLQA